MTEHLIKVSAIIAYFVNHSSLIKRGENSYESANVKKIVFDADTRVIRVEVSASMKQRTYKIEIVLTEEFEIESAKCQCPRGIEICHLIAATLFASRYAISKTDVNCSWNPTPTDSSQTKTAREVFNVKKPNRVTNRDLNDNEIDDLYQSLLKIPPVGFRWILKPEVSGQDTDLNVPDVAFILLSRQFTEANNGIAFLTEKLKLTQSVILDTMIKTIGQANNPDWYSVRQNRITASVFGIVLASIKRNRFPPSLYSTLYDRKDLSRVKAIEWGLTHEKEGLKILSKKLKKEIQPCGVFLSESGVLGASPDGTIDENCIVEVKCPYKYRKLILTEVLKTDKSYIFYYNDNDTLSINKNHPYYHQVQGQIYLCGRKCCYLCVWTPQQVIYCLIHKDNSWGTNLKLIENFYFDKFVKFILSKLL